MGNGIPSSDTRWGAPEPAISFTNNGEANEAPGVGGTFFDTNGDEIDGGFGGGALGLAPVAVESPLGVVLSIFGFGCSTSGGVTPLDAAHGTSVLWVPRV